MEAHVHEIAVLAEKALAIRGSKEMFRSFSIASFLFLSSIRWSTQAAKGSPMTVLIILITY
jgi:hypothetical protein